MNYKKYKHKINKIHVDVILKQNVFVAVFQIKFLNANDWVDLKKLISSLNLNLFVCKCYYLKNNVVVKNIVKYDSLYNGNILILYSNEPLLFSLKQVFFVKNKNIIPLYFFLFGRFLFPFNYASLVELFSKTGIVQLISLLECKKIDLLNSMSASHNFLINLKR